MSKDKKRETAYIVVLAFALISVLIFGYLRFNDNEKSHIVSISTNYFNSCYVTDEGELYVTGLNLDKTYAGDEVIDGPIIVNTDCKVVEAVISLNAILYYDEYGDVYMLGMVGMENSTSVYSKEPVKIAELKNVIDVAAGEMHYMALDREGNVWVWGKNSSKQVSENVSDIYIEKPTKKEGIYNVKGIECGYYTSCVYTEDSVVLWGEDSFSITEESSFSTPYKIEIQEVQQISIGRNHMLIETNKGIYGFGSNCFGQMGDVQKEILYEEKLDIDVTQDLEFSCGYTCSVFIIDGVLYYLGAINPFSQDDSEEVTELTEINVNDRSVIDVDIRAFHLVYTTSDNVYYLGDNDYGQCGTALNNKESEVQEIQSENIVAVLDTGFDTNNTTLLDALCSKKNIEHRTTYANCSMFNLMDGKEEVYANVLSDGHGTAIIGSVVGIKYDDRENLSFNKNIKILSLKVMDAKGGKFIDVITGLRISEYRQAKIANCSLSIDGDEYKPFVKYIADNMETMIIFAINNNQENNSILVNSEKVVYVMDRTQGCKIEGSNIVYIDGEEIAVILPDNRLATMSGNSIAASIVTNKIIENISLFDDITFSTILESGLFE